MVKNWSLMATNSRIETEEKHLITRNHFDDRSSRKLDDNNARSIIRRGQYGRDRGWRKEEACSLVRNEG